MHVPDGFVAAPTALATAGVGAAAVGYSLRVAGRQLEDRQIPLVGVTAAFVFAAQMLNFPVAFGTSGHLVGGALAGILLGPWLACLVLAVVLLVQAVGFADGGITALGANVVLMGLIAGAGGAYAFRFLARVLPSTRTGFLTAAGITAWLSVLVASAACTAMIWLGGPFGPEVVPFMLGLHALVGVGEAVITVAVVSTVMAARPDLLATAALLPPALRHEGVR